MSKTRPRSNSNTTSWFHRKAKLQTLLGTCGDDEEEGIALDRIIHNHSLAKAQSTTEIDKLRFSDKDLDSFGPLADAQFGTVELVSCRLDSRVYVRKRVLKKFALKTREQCSPQNERHILLLALKSQSCGSESWTPHMLCAYQCPIFLNIVMEYAAGGSLWDVLESSSEGRLAAADLEWWTPQCVSAIDWLHSHAGFVHRDIKPHNFVVRPGPTARLLLIDFGSAAPLLKPRADGVRYVSRSYCLVPCGTCDYISPEILQAHEEALVALELPDDESNEIEDSDAELPEREKRQRKDRILQGEIGYGRETDWWSLGAMLYELAFGIAPFFAKDIRQTYARIMNHESNLTFNINVPVPPALVDLIKGLLTHHESRLGRHSADEVRKHNYFNGVDWSNIYPRPSPPGLLLPEFTYTKPLIPPELEEDNSGSTADGSKAFAFSALFQSSITSRPNLSSFHSFQYDQTATPAFGRRSLSRGDGASGSAERSIASFIGFSWGPPKDAFDDATRIVPAEPASTEPGLCALSNHPGVAVPQHPLVTPKRPSRGTAPPSTVRVTSVRRSAQSRPVSDREAMRMLVNCVGQSARKRVLESGKKPKVLLPHFGFEPPTAGAGLGDSLGKGPPPAPSFLRTSPRSSLPSAVRKELRFDETTTQFMPNLSYTNTFTTTLSNSGMSGGLIPYAPSYSASDSGTMSSEAECPPSPSPSPRPGSAMSILSMSRRSATPTVSGTYLSVLGRSSSEPPELRPRARAGSLGSQHGCSSGSGTVSQTPRRARFANSAVPSPIRAKERIPSTPHPQARHDKFKDQQPARRVQLPDSPAQTTNNFRERALATPHPRARIRSKKEDSLHVDASIPLDLAEQKLPQPPRPNAHPRRNSKPPLQVRHSRMTSTPMQSSPHVALALGESSDESGTDAGQHFGSSSSTVNDDELEKDAETIMEDDDTETHLDDSESRALDVSSSSEESDYFHHNRLSAHNVATFEDMERRYRRLMEDIANVKLHVDEFSCKVRYTE